MAFLTLPPPNPERPAPDGCGVSVGLLTRRKDKKDMDHKQRKALGRRRAIAKARNVRKRNRPKTGAFLGLSPFRGLRGRTYRLWDL